MTLYKYTIRWPLKDESIHSIQITGNFDNWSRSLPTIKSTKEYVQEIKLDTKQDVVFKFIINDDQWIVNDQFKVTHDEHGNSNNIIYADELIEESEKIPVVSTTTTTDAVVAEEKKPLKIDTKDEETPVVPKKEKEIISSTHDDTIVPPVVSTPAKKEIKPEVVAPQLDKKYEEDGIKIGVPTEKFVEEFQQQQEEEEEEEEIPTKEYTEPSIKTSEELLKKHPKGIPEPEPEPEPEHEVEATIPEPEIYDAEELEAHRDTAVVVGDEHESFVEPDIVLKSPSKSIITEDDIISDIETAPSQTAKHHDELPHPSAHQQQQPLTQVLTSSSSFAAISSPPLSSDYENLEKYDNEEQARGGVKEEEEGEEEEEGDDTEYNTASNSGISTEKKENPLVAAYQENKPVKPVLLSHVSETTLDASGATTGSGSAPSGDTTPKIPGHYPTSPEHKSSSTTSLSSNNNVTQKESTYNGKRESLISRFKSLFR